MKYQIGELLVEPDSHRVIGKNQEFELTGINLMMFLALVRHYPNPLAGETLAQEVWQKSHVSADTIKKRFSLLKKELAEVEMGELIKSLPNQSYVLSEAPVEIGQNQEALQGQVKINKLKSLIVIVLIIIISVAAVVFLNDQDQPPMLHDPVTGKTLVAPPSEH